MADAHLLDLVSQRLANPLDQRLVRLGQRLLMFTALFILEIAQLQIALGLENRRASNSVRWLINHSSIRSHNSRTSTPF